MQRVTYDTDRICLDMASRGWEASDLARKIRERHPSTAISSVTRFLNGQHQSAPMAKRIAEALGHTVRRYLAPASEAVSK